MLICIFHKLENWYQGHQCPQIFTLQHDSRAAFCHWFIDHLEWNTSISPALKRVHSSHPRLLFFSVHLSSTYCKHVWWDWRWKGLPVATDPITKPVFPVLRSTGSSMWWRKSRAKETVCCEFMFSCVFVDTHTHCTLKPVCLGGGVYVFQRLIGCWGPPLVEVNIREQTTYYYWSTRGQNNNPCVSRYSFLILVMDSAALIGFREGSARVKHTDGNIEIQREKYWPSGTKTKSNKKKKARNWDLRIKEQ